jgi:hypothetical protein
VPAHNADVLGVSACAAKYVGTIVSPYIAEAAPVPIIAIKAKFFQPFVRIILMRKAPIQVRFILDIVTPQSIPGTTIIFACGVAYLW